jgi:dTDP-4-dehydrorhamnose 3,5-epimerase-like enzyme
MDNSFINEVQLFEIRTFSDDRGSLCVIESHKDLAFCTKRIFYVFDTKKNVTRGDHAHKKSKQFLVVLQGALRVTVETRYGSSNYLLSSPTIGLYLPPMTWTIETPTEDGTIYLVLSSEEYDDSDYIRNHSDFIKAGDTS